mmetsp:Transcript_34050/g.109304  ORF Transcript_34050/g.109304 Transcript_34050/m.109304 type:complete len:204 (-) Transcript_34050:513-1124(-)
MGSLYLQKNTLTSPSKILGSDWTTRLMLRKATYVISSRSEFNKVTNGGASFFRKFAMASSSSSSSGFSEATLEDDDPEDDPARNLTYFKITFTADMTTAEFACWSRGETRSMMDVASLASTGEYLARASKIETCPHSVHSLRAASNFWRAELDSSMTASSPEVSAISFRAATALATTVGFGSATRSRSVSTKPLSTTRSGWMS